MMPFDNVVVRQQAGIAAAEEIELISSQSKLQHLSDIDQVQKLTWSNIDEEIPIGVGGFSRVYKAHVVGIKNRKDLPLQLKNNKNDIDDESKDDGQNENQYYAVKCLNVRTLEGHSRHFCTGAADLAAEGLILSRLRHDNVIRIHGMSSGKVESAFTDSERGYFLVLDLLYDTLSSKLDKYLKKNNKKKGNMNMSRRALWASSISSPMSFASERIKYVALGVAKGLAYLHSMGVV